MSNFDSTKINILTKKSDKKNKKSSSTEVTAQTRWSFIQSDLGAAANEWTVLDSKHVSKTPDEEHFEKVKNIIENLKDQLNDF